MVTFSLFSTNSLYHSETKQGFYHQKLNVRVAERLKTEDVGILGNSKKIFKILGFDGEFPVVHSKAKF